VLYASHAGALIIGSQDLLSLLFGVSAAWLEHAAFAASLAPKLLAAAGIMTILDDVCAAATTAFVNNCLYYHANIIPSL
jgi:hypothetical protein